VGVHQAAGGVWSRVGRMGRLLKGGGGSGGSPVERTEQWHGFSEEEEVVEAPIKSTELGCELADFLCECRRQTAAPNPVNQQRRAKSSHHHDHHHHQPSRLSPKCREIWHKYLSRRFWLEWVTVQYYWLEYMKLQ
jgi:hypothetical protein